ncbi:Eco57I restriction-modification methylase domain-containing protein [Paraburkholderia sp. A1RO-5L]|uniref:Eco57I restriction-modification methylase domain-containing protein n=1 Tax=Paraburkholderia sp. A1RO-5L TaxID=3028370 RepID=UPI003B7FF2B6
MARKKITTLAYRAIRIEGGLIPADELSRLTTLTDPDSTEQTEMQYRIPKGLKLRDEIGRDFKIALSLWADFLALRKRSDVNAYEVTVREFLLPLMRHVLHFADIDRCVSIESGGHSYAIGYIAERGQVPLVFAGFDQSLDAPAERFGETNPDTGKVRRRSPYMLAQEALNASDASLWAIVTNGLTLRILRDNFSLTRPAYVEVDLEALFTEELYSDFTAFWLLAHASRFSCPAGEPTNCVWERWRTIGQETGVTVRTNLRYQVADALRALGTGFLSHPANSELRTVLQRQDGEFGALSQQAFFEELLRLVYRLIFLSTVEDRIDKANGHRLIFTPDASPEVQQRYLAGYSMTWLRERAVRRSQHDRHSDLWQALTITFGALAKGERHLGLPALGGLFDADQCTWLDGAQLENRWLLSAVFQLGWFRADGGLTRVNYRDMGPEELGSVYESLLELVPDLQMLSQPAAARLAFVGDDDTAGSAKGNTRKLTGSYYTPDSLVQELIKTALEPVIADTVRANPARPVEALLDLTICDPACGSGHFLLAAARRLADEVALHRAAAEREAGAPTPVDFRHALRDVVSRCIYGVDKNPMAIQLAKTALWLEAYTPDRPLSFVDHHLRVGDALLGVLDPKVLEQGIPDEAYNALSGDDKNVASTLKKQNKADLKSWRAIASGDLLTQAGLAAQALSVETLDDDTPEHLALKRQAWAAADAAAHRGIFARLADTYVAAFLAPKLAAVSETVPLSGFLWGLFSGHPVDTEVEDAAQALCRQHSAFHWWVAFPQVAVRGGFSVMLGNPPWEQLQLSEEEFFASRAPSIASMAGATRKAAIAALETEAPRLWTQLQDARRQNDAANLFFRAGGRFPLSAYGKLDTYPLFAETFLQATHPDGRAGFIVKAGIATDDSNKRFFAAVVEQERLVSLLGFDNAERIFPAVHPDTPFVLVTLGAATDPTQLLHYALRVEHLQDARRRFTLTRDEFALINPNTRTCPVFRSVRDAELTKKLYRAAPVLIEEAVVDADGNVVRPEVNPWGITFSQGLFNMTSDSSLFLNTPARDGQPPRLPLYEAKMMHQFDHRWATYIDALGGNAGEVETTDVNLAQKTDPTFTPRPRYWVDECEVLARIARAPVRVTKGWLALHASGRDVSSAHADDALADLLAALAAWVAGELFTCTAGIRATSSGWTTQQALPHIAQVENAMRGRFPRLYEVLQSNGLTTKKALTEFPKWAVQNADARLDNNELDRLAEVLRASHPGSALLELLDVWLDRRSPRWLMGWRDITNATNERTVIASVLPRAGVGNNLPLMLFGSGSKCGPLAALLGNLCSLTFDFVARHKVGGTHLNYFIYKQLPVLSPECYTASDLNFIVPRVIELTYTAYDLKPWADDLAAYDPRPVAERGQPFAWNPARRAQLRAELDAYYARLYGLNRDELRYILDPADVMGADYPSETFRVLKKSEMQEFKEFRTQRLVLDAWDRQVRGLPSADALKISQEL